MSIASTSSAPSQNQPDKSQSASQPNVIVAQGDWTKNLVQLAKTAELKKHSLSLQLHTAHIVSHHATIDAKEKALQDLKEQQNRLDSERRKLLTSLAEINKDRDRADMRVTGITKDIDQLWANIHRIQDNEYAEAKRAVDELRAEVGKPPWPSLQATLEEKAALFLKERLANAPPHTTSHKREAPAPSETSQPPAKRRRGYPRSDGNDVKTEGSQISSESSGSSPSNHSPSLSPAMSARSPGSA